VAGRWLEARNGQFSKIFAFFLSTEKERAVCLRQGKKQSKHTEHGLQNTPKKHWVNPKFTLNNTFA